MRCLGRFKGILWNILREMIDYKDFVLKQGIIVKKNLVMGKLKMFASYLDKNINNAYTT